jgi:hypothetical protein
LTYPQYSLFHLYRYTSVQSRLLYFVLVLGTDLREGEVVVQEFGMMRK